MFIAIVILFIVAIYVGIGVLFGALFVTYGIGTIDRVAVDASWMVRLALMPGAVALWPLLWAKWATSPDRRGGGHA